MADATAGDELPVGGAETAGKPMKRGGGNRAAHGAAAAAPWRENYNRHSFAYSSSPF